MIALRDVVVRYGERTVLDGLSLDLPVGVTAVMGPNGSGKTTLGRVLLGLVRPSSGTVDGLTGLTRAAAFQEDRLCEQLSADANVRLVLPRSSGHAAARDGLRAVGLDESAWGAPVRTLSGGQRRRVALVRALAPGADLVVLDEPFTGLDVAGRAAVVAWMRERLVGRTALLVTHDPAEAAAFDAPVVHLGGPPAPAREECDAGDLADEA
jgi:NitT/TauT family transport system ATP-binding protein